LEPWQYSIALVVALVVGALIPLAAQLAVSLRAGRATSARLAEQAERALAVVTATAERLDRLTARLEEGRRLERLLAGIDAASASAARLDQSLKIASALGAAVGPAIGAAVHAWRSEQAGPSAPPGRSGNGAGAAEQRKETKP
jgi:hypothetical protein